MRISGLWRLLCHPGAAGRLFRRRRTYDERLLQLAEERWESILRGETRTIPFDEFVAGLNARAEAQEAAVVH